ncbi:hypothetical protein D5086_017718 [Populus alba]|uniref:Uncharacterized protein n=1 Tax=Populus alba TaxID=43335 RepID=A0ACC4BMQ6_POPAL
MRVSEWTEMILETVAMVIIKLLGGGAIVKMVDMVTISGGSRVAWTNTSPSWTENVRLIQQWVGGHLWNASGIVFSLPDSLANVLHGSRELRVRESTMISLFTFAAKRLDCPLLAQLLRASGMGLPLFQTERLSW